MAQNWLFKKSNKIDKYKTGLIEKRDKAQIANIRNDREDIIINSAATNGKKGYYEQFYISEFNNLDETGKFKVDRNYKLRKLTGEYIDLYLLKN